jgi:hypothetical protein
MFFVHIPRIHLTGGTMRVMRMFIGVKALKVVTIQINYVCLIDDWEFEGEVREEEEKDKNSITNGLTYYTTWMMALNANTILNNTTPRTD